ncbi:roundabout homolog 4 isoform X2 [Ascaphus truei]|uniref:roundabout homolog 4 isoform X2 n=1 Tax=Ascaphus truei TaxID=8439 RepID=UPI003F59DB5A
MWLCMHTNNSKIHVSTYHWTTMSPFWIICLVIAFSADVLLLEGSKSRLEEFSPLIIDHPADLVVRRDQPATLNCRAEGNPKPTIEWYRNGEYVETSKDDAHSQRTLLLDGSLFFFRLNQRKGKTDEGVYTCVARNPLGTAFSRNASLYIAALREDFRLKPSDAVISAGNPLVVECLPPKGHPEPTVTWKKDGVLINHNNARYTISTGKLSVAYALKTDSGVYVCVASNQVGEKESKAAIISVLEKPVFTKKPNDIVATFGSTVQFWCGTHGDPKPLVRWNKEHGELPTGRYDISSENTLRIQYVTMHDSGKYICTAENQVESVSVKASLVVQDLLDTGQMDKQKEIHRELANIRVNLDNITALPTSLVYVHWKVLSQSHHTEGYSVFYRPHPPADFEWTEWTLSRVNEFSTIIPSLRRGQRYEFKVRPFAGKIYGSDSNIKLLRIPDEVPNIAPQNINVTTVEGANGTIVVSWEPLPKSAQYGNIKGYKVWCFGNKTYHQVDWIVDEGTKSLEIPMLASGIQYQIQVAAINDAGIGMPSKPKYIIIEFPQVNKKVEKEKITFGHIMQVLRHPAFIATVGTVIWVLLMIVAVYMCQHHAKHYSTKKPNVLGNGLYRFASEDTIIKHRMDTSDSPWLSNTWKSTSCSKNYSSTTSMNSQLLWNETKDTVDFHKSTISFERKSEGSRSQVIPLVPESRSLYGTLYVDLPGKDMTTFQCPSFVKLSGIGPNGKTPEQLGLFDHSHFPQYFNNVDVNNSFHGGTRRKLPWIPIVPVSPNCKKELHQANSAPLSPSIQTSGQSGSVPSIRSLDINQVSKGEYAKVMKTLSSPKILQHTSSVKVMNLLPPPPSPPPKEDSDSEDQEKMVCNISHLSSYSQSKQENCQTKNNFNKENMPLDTLTFQRLSTASLSFSMNEDGYNVLTPEDVAQYLELGEQGEISRHHLECNSSLPRPFSSVHTYGYICSPLPSDLVETDSVDEDDDPEGEEVNSMKSYRKYCETPTSSISEYETSMAGSLVNGWGSVSEDNFTSARCSMVSSSDGSFLMDANFAKALAVAVDSFCFGTSQEARETDRFHADYSPPASPLDGMLSTHNHGENVGISKNKSKVNPLPVLDWNIDWMDEMEDKYRKKNEMKHHFPFDKKVKKELEGRKEDGTFQVALSAAQASINHTGNPLQKTFSVHNKVESNMFLNFPLDPSGLTVVKV